MKDTVYIPNAMTYLDEDDGHVYIITFLLQVAATQVNQPEMFSRDSPWISNSPLETCQILQETQVLYLKSLDDTTNVA